MLYQGVPEYRLPRDLIRAEVDQVLALGVELRLNWRLGRDFSVGDLRRNDYAAVFLALGATRGRELNIPGRELDGVINGVDFLLNANLGYRVALGERVVVVGGGNVAIDVARTVLRYAAPETHELPEGAQQLLQTWGYDNAFLDAARTALRLGARHVQLVSLESRSEMPAHPDEVREAEEEGIALLPRPRAQGHRGREGPRGRAGDARRRVRVRRERPLQPQVRRGEREAPRSRHDHPGRGPAARHRLPRRGPRDHDHAPGPRRDRAAHARHHHARRLLRGRPRLRSADRDRGGGRRQARRAGHPRVARRRRGAPRPRPLPADRARPGGGPLRPDPPAGGAEPARRAPHRLPRGRGGLPGGAGADRGLALPVVQRGDGLRLGALHPLQRLRRDLPGGLPRPRARVAACGGRRSWTRCARRWGRTHRQGRS